MSRVGRHRRGGKAGRALLGEARGVPRPLCPAARAVTLGRAGQERPRSPGFVRGAQPPERHSWARRPAPRGRRRLDRPPGQMGRSGFPRPTRGNRARRAGARPGTAPGERCTDGAGAAGGGRWVRGRPAPGRQRVRADVRGQMFAGGGTPGKNQLLSRRPPSAAA